MKKVALLLFNTLARGSRFWGNMELSLLAGEMERAGVDSRLFVLLMRPDEEARNRRTIDEFAARAAAGGFGLVVLHSAWVPWLPAYLRERTGARVLCLDGSDRDDLPAALRPLDSHTAAIAAALGLASVRGVRALLARIGAGDRFEPRFDYTFLGGEGPLRQELAFVSLQSCPYGKEVRGNPRFAGAPPGAGVSTRGCSYCASAMSYRELPEQEKRRRLLAETRCLLERLPGLEEIAVPFPEDYLGALTWLVREGRSLGLRPVVFSGQFRAGALLRHAAAIEELVRAAAGGGFGFRIGVVGLESFSDDDLLLYNRDDSREVRGAVEALHAMRGRLGRGRFMPATVGSFILFHPWQTPASLRRSVEGMLEAQVEGLFPALNFNDLRIGPQVPLHALAAKEGLLEEPRHGASVPRVPLGGYFSERPWRFKDPLVARVHGLWAALSPRTPERIGLLSCLLDSSAALPGGERDAAAIAGGLARLHRLVSERGAAAASEGDIVAVGRRCNSSCLACPSHRGAFAEEKDEAMRLLGERAAGDAVTIGGREPTMLRWLPDLVAGARRRGARDVRLVTNARMLAYASWAGTLAAAGTTGISVKLHGAGAGAHDRESRSPGAFAQALEGARRMREALRRRGARGDGCFCFVVTRRNLDALDEMAGLAAREGAGEARFALPLAGLPLERLDEIGAALEGAIGRARRAGLRAGTDPRLSFRWNNE